MFKAIYTCLRPWFSRGFLPRAVVSGFFYCPHAAVPHTKASTMFWWRGREGITLNQGGRVHEGSAPSDKRVNKLMECAGHLNPDPINKAAEHIKGRTPMWTPQVQIAM